MPIRVCATPNCWRKFPSDTGAYCSQCARVRAAIHAADYGTEYREQLRAPRYLAATHCETCGCRFTPDNPKTGGHSVALRKGGRGSRIKPECARCNYGWVKTGS